MTQINFKKEASEFIERHFENCENAPECHFAGVFIRDFALHLANKYPQEEVGKIERLEIPTQSFQFYEVGLIFKVLFDKINQLIDRENKLGK